MLTGGRDFIVISLELVKLRISLIFASLSIDLSILCLCLRNYGQYTIPQLQIFTLNQRITLLVNITAPY